jgi:hypothetical protein
MFACTRRSLLRSIGSTVLAGSSLIRPTAAETLLPYHERVLMKHPVAYWRFDERAGPIARDSTVHGHNGTYQGGVAFGNTGAIRSEPDAAIGLNGVDAFVAVPDSKAFSQPTSRRGLTVEAWFRPDTLTFQGETDQHYVHWLGKGEPGAFEWGFRFYSKDSPRPPGIRNEGAGAYFQDDLEPGVWIHVVACYDPGDASNPKAGVRIYKNGVLRGKPETSPGALYATFNIHPAHGIAPVRLGTRDKGSFLAGGLDDVAIYPRVLSGPDILDNYNGA